MSVSLYKINYKSDFVITIDGDAGWTTPFCIKFWTGMPSKGYFVGYDGVKYVNCKVGDTPDKLVVLFDDHHMPIGELKMQIAYHTTIAEFPGSVFDEVTNARDVIVGIDGTEYQVMLDFEGETAPELEFNLPAYANEQERIQNELQRQENEAQRIQNELEREQASAAAVAGAEKVDAELNGNTLTVTNRNGVSKSVNTKGSTGPQGPQGEQGEQGPQGVQGPQGPQGVKGDKGATGATGPQGPTGVSITGFTYSSETEEYTTYTIAFSDGNNQAVNIPKGEKGDPGNTGPQGATGATGNGIASTVLNNDYTLTITFTDGTTYTTSSIRGEQGDRGPQGLQGNSGYTGAAGELEIVNNLTDGGATKALSAEMGKELYETTPTNGDGGNGDLSVIDEQGYAIVEFKDGQVKTKNFDSANVSNLQETSGEYLDFAVSDNNGNAILLLANGNIKTKNFDSKRILQKRTFSDLFQSQINPFGIGASRFFLRAGKRAWFTGYAPLIIVAGQSNADGRVPYTDAPTWLSGNNYAIDNYLVWDTETSSFQTYNVIGMTGNSNTTQGQDKYAFDAQFAHDWLAQYGGNLYMVRETRGDVGIADEPSDGWTWNPDVDNIASGCNSMCLELMNKVIAAIKYAQEKNIVLVPVCVLWHQGEHDATSVFVSSYQQNLANLIMWMRGMFLAPNLPFICGDIVSNYNAYHQQINEIIEELATEDNYMADVSMQGHETTIDGLHYDASAIAYLGSQMFVEIQNYI